uniref:PAP-associated domain-containing protein n=1 Tax=Plectus sambesii TaxID=2011161 RepID=A0A914UKS5_9BILA
MVFRGSGLIRASSSRQLCECVRNCCASVSQRHLAKKSSPTTSVESELEKAENESAPRLPRGDPFTRWLGERRKEARRSLLVQVESGASIDSVWSGNSPCIPDIGQFDPSRQLFQLDSNCYLLDLKSERVVANILTGLGYGDRSEDILPVRTRMLTLRAKHAVRPSLRNTANERRSAAEATSTSLTKQLIETPNLDAQIRKLHLLTQTTERGRRTRFFLASVLEEALMGVFPGNKMIPFGSSVSGFGDDQSDVDLCWSLNFRTQPARSNALELTCKSASDLIVGTPLADMALDLSRVKTQKALETLSDVLERFVPGIERMSRILNARVPIISFHHSIIGAKCDISGDLRLSIDMTRLLWLTTQAGDNSDERVAQVVSAVRFWAKHVDLQHAGFGRCVSNFMLTTLVLFFLQQISLIPTFQQLSVEGDPLSVTANHLRKCRRSVGTLLAQFFSFYSEFDFSHKGVCLWTGAPVIKPYPVPLYIRNPLDFNHNIAQNVTGGETENFLRCCQSASAIANSRRFSRTAVLSGPWGLLHFVDPKRLESDGIDIPSNRPRPVKTLDSTLGGINSSESVNANEESASDTDSKPGPPRRKIRLPAL